MNENTGLNEVLSDVKGRIGGYIQAETRSRKAQKALRVGIVGFSAVLLMALALYSSHYYLLLALHGFSSSPDCLLYSTLDSNGEEHRVIVDRSDRIPKALTHLRKNAFGLWTVVETRRIDADNHMISMDIVTERSVDTTDSALQTSVYQHQGILVGDSAIKEIPDLSENTSENYTFNVDQWGDRYMIRLAWCGPENTSLELLSLSEWLRIDGYVLTPYPAMALK